MGPGVWGNYSVGSKRVEYVAPRATAPTRFSLIHVLRRYRRTDHVSRVTTAHHRAQSVNFRFSKGNCPSFKFSKKNGWSFRAEFTARVLEQGSLNTMKSFRSQVLYCRISAHNRRDGSHYSTESDGGFWTRQEPRSRSREELGGHTSGYRSSRSIGFAVDY